MFRYRTHPGVQSATRLQPKDVLLNERNLKRLRENGEITQDNDVICNLKDFNQHRQELHKSQLYYILQAYKRRESEQYDRMLIANAESITKRITRISQPVTSALRRFLPERNYRSRNATKERSIC